MDENCIRTTMPSKSETKNIAKQRNTKSFDWFVFFDKSKKDEISQTPAKETEMFSHIDNIFAIPILSLRYS
jgi:hypothetical protein